MNTDINHKGVEELSPIQIECIAITANRFFTLWNRTVAAVALTFRGGDVQNNSFSILQINPALDFELAGGFSLLFGANQCRHLHANRRRQIWNLEVSAAFRAVHNSCRSIHGLICMDFDLETQGVHD